MQRRLMSWAGLSGALLFVLSVIIGGWQFNGYSHTEQFISETYASGTSAGPLLRWLGFLPAGLLMAAFGLVLSGSYHTNPSLRWGLVGIGIWYGLGTVVVSLAPCDAGCDPEQATPSLAHVIHFAMGGLTYLLTPPSILLIAFGATRETRLRAISPWLMGAGLVMLSAVVLLFADALPGAKGLV
ncbi:MAG: DUF998 domain-containing protein [Flavobacteriales bacterium]|nr:DUF998 domain-containing protein [Flavobacteriales bacterium]